MQENAPDKNTEEKVLIKRNNQAPSFFASVAGNRSQMIIERWIQWKNIDIQEYIDSNRVLTILIPIVTLRQWYPGPNWKKDIAKVCSGQMKDIKKISQPNGNFKLFSLFSYAELSDEGLSLDVIPKVLQYYIVGKNNLVTSLDYEVTALFKSKYSHQMYWEMCMHDTPRDQYRFFLTPEAINEKYETKYNVTNILEEILIPTQKEIKKVYDQNYSPRFFTFKERREVIGKSKTIVGWEFIIHNEARSKRQDLQAQEAYRNIDYFLQKYLEKYRMNILSQVKCFNSEKIIQLWMRLELFHLMDKKDIRSIPAYLSSIFPHYGVDPRAVAKDSLSQKDMPLFEKEEIDTATGIKYWLQCIGHINESPTATDSIKMLFSKLQFYSYCENTPENRLILRGNEQICHDVETYFAPQFREVLKKYFPENLILKYYATKQ